jgi:hypothetical protein
VLPLVREVALLPAPDAIRRTLWDEQVPRLMRLMKRHESMARSYLGKLLKETGDNAAILAKIITDCEAAAPADPAAWIRRHVQVATGTGPRLAPGDLGRDHKERARELDRQRAAREACDVRLASSLICQPRRMTDEHPGSEGAESTFHLARWPAREPCRHPPARNSCRTTKAAKPRRSSFSQSISTEHLP